MVSRYRLPALALLNVRCQEAREQLTGLAEGQTGMYNALLHYIKGNLTSKPFSLCFFFQQKNKWSHLKASGSFTKSKVFRLKSGIKYRTPKFPFFCWTTYKPLNYFSMSIVPYFTFFCFQLNFLEIKMPISYMTKCLLIIESLKKIDVTAQ